MISLKDNTKFLALFASALSGTVYLIASSARSRLGFPLDDAWIHQTYERNLAREGTWSFLAGQPSGGSTSPLWTLALALGDFLGVGPKIWSYALGILLLSLIGFVGTLWFRRRNPKLKQWFWMVPLLLGIEWHLAWASVSGMETLAITFIVLVVFWQLEVGVSTFLIGLVVGMGVWVRPGAVTLLLPVALMVLKRSSGIWAPWLKDMLRVAMGSSLIILPYLVFNQVITGSIWPNTFYAKQAEYAILQQAPLYIRWLQQFSQPMIGLGIVLLPGVLLLVWRRIREGALLDLTPLIWISAYLALYAYRLPVTYQHGRYAIPTIPILLLFGLEGLLYWIDPNSRRTLIRLFSRAWIVLLIPSTLAFWILGANAYAVDVSIIESEMVELSRWIEKNTDPGALIAAHDIGALGYFGGREILDLAGLISPEVIPFIRDEKRLREYLDFREADYLMTFPNWYEMLNADLVPIYQSTAPFSPAAGGENMAIYRWP